jgi:peptidoglycan hydrolase-like protein with peptidoglycan-binding domain
MANYDSNAAIVKQVQQAVNVDGYTPALTEDGKYGPNTQKGVLWFQMKHGLSADGVIGDQTQATALGVLQGHQAASAAPVDLDTFGTPASPIPSPAAALLPMPVAMSMVAPALTPIAVPPPVPKKHLDLHFGPVAGPASPAPMALSLPMAAPPAAAPIGKKSKIPSWATTATGGVVGALAGGPLGLLLGAALGGGVDFARHTIAQKPAALAAHGETTFGGEPELDLYDPSFTDEPMIVAGEMGLPSAVSILKG